MAGKYYGRTKFKILESPVCFSLLLNQCSFYIYQSGMKPFCNIRISQSQLWMQKLKNLENNSHKLSSTFTLGQNEHNKYYRVTQQWNSFQDKQNSVQSSNYAERYFHRQCQCGEKCPRLKNIYFSSPSFCFYVHSRYCSHLNQLWESKR